MFQRPALLVPDPVPPLRLLQTLQCPACGEPPDLGVTACPSCGRPDRTESGAFDYLYGEWAESARRFAELYIPLRTREGWRDRSGREDPDRRIMGSRLWRHRKRAAEAAGKIVRDYLFMTEPPLVADVGAGGAWLARLLPFALTAAVDVIEPPVGGGSHLRIRADMRRMPFRDACLNAAVYCSSLQYGPVRDGIAEAARVLRPGGILVVVESAVFTDAESAAAAHRKTEAYLARAGFAGLAAYHYPIVASELRAALEGSGMVVERLDEPPAVYGPTQMMRGARAFPTLVARRS